MICVNKLPNFKEYCPNMELVPAYAGESVGLDLYNAGPDIYYNRETPLKTLIPTGLRVRIPPGYVGLIMGRSSITKRSLTQRAGVIDPGYTGEVKVNAVLVNSELDIIRAGEKLPFQLIVVAAQTDFTEVDDEQYDGAMLESIRGLAGFGSTDIEPSQEIVKFPSYGEIQVGSLMPCLLGSVSANTLIILDNVNTINM